ncbi:MAG: Cof-like hydrolase [Bacilli bacterium]|nr:Cof-like hydrolase [Bacilli bacterium]
MGKYKLLALDMDGTVLNEQQQISDVNREAIYAAIEAGVTVMFSTGRGIQSAQPYIDELKLQSPIVTVNGSEVWQAPGMLLNRHLMDVKWIRSMHEMAAEHDTWYWAYSVEGIFNRDNWPGDLNDLHWLKFGFYTEDQEKLTKIRHVLQAWDVFEITNSHPFNLEMNPIGISKASGIQDVCKLLGIDMSEVIAMGDSMNDIKMIRAAGLGVAMGNAQVELKQAADLVTVSNDEDGVAQIIRQYILS